MSRLHRSLQLLTAAALVAGGLTVAADAAAATLPDNCASQSATTVACQYSYTGGEQTFTVPAGVTAVHVDAIGAAGGDYSDNGPYGGRGARVSGDLTGLAGGETLYVEVGGAGQRPPAYDGAFNGGGPSEYGPGGGGASDVRTTSITTVSDPGLSYANDTRLIVAGGGGGAGIAGDCAGGAGGDADANGAPGGSACADSGVGGSAGPPASTPVTPGTYVGDLGQGAGFGYAGSGGGGYYGGGAGGTVDRNPGTDAKVGGSGGGGGGSSLVPQQNPSGPTPTTAPASVTITYQTSDQPRTTSLLGNTSIPRLQRDGLAASSPCPSGSFMVGARVWLDTFPRVTGVAALCSNGAGSPTVGLVVGDTSDAVTSGDSVCDGTDPAVGLTASNGEVVNAVGVRCAGAGGTYGATVVGMAYGGNPSTTRYNADCDSGLTMTGISGWYNIYGGPHNNVYGVQGICKARTTTSIDSTLPTSAVVVGQAVVTTFSVTSQDGSTPSGSVTVTASTGESCTAPLTDQARGGCDLQLEHAGTPTLTATYGDTADYVGSTSAAVPYTVNQASTTTTITGTDPDPSAVGQPVTVDYAVAVGAPGAGSPTGTVTVTGDNTTGCTGSVAAGSCALTFTAKGPSELVATYNGDSDFGQSQSPAVVHTVGATQQTITVTSMPPSPAYPTQTYVPAATAPGGDVDVTIDPSTVGYGTDLAACTLTDGTVSFDRPGSCVLDFDQAGNATYDTAPQVQQQIAVQPIAVTATAVLTPATLVYGQDASVTVTATVTAGPASLVGTTVSSGSVNFGVGDRTFVPTAVDANGQASYPSLLAGGSLPAGSYEDGARYLPAEGSIYTGVDKSGSVSIGLAGSATTLHVASTSLSADVAAVAPGAGTPTGSVTFFVDGSPIGTAELADGSATLGHTVPVGKGRQVAAQYSGDANFLASSASTARKNPTITAHVTSSTGTSRYGWYRTPVTVSFTCTTSGAALTTGCPKPVTLSRDGARQSVTRTIAAADGGMSTVTVRGINIDRTAPSVKVTGAKNGAVYTATAPKARCSGTDTLSGIASCRLTSHTTSKAGTRRVTYTATATDKAGNVRHSSVTVTVSPFGFTDATFTDGAWTVRRGHTYTLAGLTSGARPRYVDAAPYDRKPHGLDHYFHAAGHVGSAKRWTLGVTMEQRLRSHRYWNIGVLVGKTTYVIRIRVV